MSNPIVNVAFKRGWWNSIIDALRDAGPEYSALATDLRNAVDRSTSPAAPLATGGPVPSGQPFLKEARERFIPMASPPPAPPAAKADQRVTLVYVDAMVGALRKVSQAFPPHTATHRVLTLLAREFTNPTKAGGYSYGRPVDPERDGVAPPPAATTGAANPAADESATGARTPEATPSPIRAMEIAWPLELDPDDRNGIAQQLEAIGHSSGLTYWLDVAKALRSIRTPQ